MNPDELSGLIGLFYDCAVAPDGWHDALTALRDALDAAFVSVHAITFPQGYPEQHADIRMLHTDWDPDWLAALPPVLHKIPHFEVMRGAPIDVPVSQMQLIDEASFRRTEFHELWVAPQGLRDTVNTGVIKRERMTAMLTAPSPASRDLYDEQDRALIARLTPHLRRALLIGDLLEAQRSAIAVHRAMLDRIAVAVLLVESGARLVHANAAGEALLEEGSCLTAIGGRLSVVSPTARAGFMAAVDRACAPEADATLGTWGNGIALASRDFGDSLADASCAVAYVLPLARSDRRHALGPGQAAVFVATAGPSRPPALEVLSALSGLTTTEARVALELADATAAGRGTEAVASALGITIATLRKHLANIYDKTGLRSQGALCAFLARLALPLDPAGGFAPDEQLQP